MSIKNEMQKIEEEWRAAEDALKSAQKLPGGTERFDALRKAGQLRFDADKRRREIEEKAARSK